MLLCYRPCRTNRVNPIREDVGLGVVDDLEGSPLVVKDEVFQVPQHEGGPLAVIQNVLVRCPRCRWDRARLSQPAFPASARVPRGGGRVLPEGGKVGVTFRHD